MKVFRITRERYIDDLSGKGAELYGGRWNAEGHSALYCSSHLSLSVLELLANQSWEIIQTGYSFIQLTIPDTLRMHQIAISDLPENWRSNPYHNYTILAGTNWLNKNKSVGLIVPSAVLPQEYNIILNPGHTDYSKIRKGKSQVLSLDGRLG